MSFFPFRGPPWTPKPRKTRGFLIVPRWISATPKATKHRKTRCFWTPWAEYAVNYRGSGTGEVTPRWARGHPPRGRRQGRHASITFGYQPKASGKGTGWPSWPAPGFKGYRPCHRPLSKQVVKMRGAAQAPATLNKRSVTLHKRVCNAEQACVQRWTSVLERCTSVFAPLHRRFGTLHKRVCNAEQATYKVGLANTEGATHKWSHMVSCRPNTL